MNNSCNETIDKSNEELNQNKCNETLSTDNILFFKCKFNGCEKQFQQKYLLECHHLRDHSIEFKDIEWKGCPENGCQFKTKFNDSFIRHELSHKSGNIDKKEFVCKWIGCDKGFNQRFSLKRHSFLHLGQIYRCKKSNCSAIFCNPFHLKSHELKHKNQFICQWIGCQKTFISRRNLRDHEFIHSGNKYRCLWPDCSATYLTPKYLQKHELIHKNNRNIVSQPTVHSEQYFAKVGQKTDNSKSDEQINCDFNNSSNVLENIELIDENITKETNEENINNSYNLRKNNRKTFITNDSEKSETELSYNYMNNSCYESEECFNRSSNQKISDKSKTKLNNKSKELKYKAIKKIIFKFNEKN